MSVQIVNGRLTLDGADLAAVADSVGTPVYVYGAESLRATYARLRAALPDVVRIHFSVKANPSLAVCRVLRNAGAAAEIASAGELALARAAGWTPDDILFAGPGKTDAELRAAVAAGVRSVNVESRGEIERLARIAADAGRTQPVCLRVNLPAGRDTDGARIVTGGGAQKFGIDVELCGAAIDAVRASDALRLDGFHFFTGSQFHDHADLLRVIDASLATARDLCTTHGIAPRLIDLGGGLGVPHRPEDPTFDIEAFGAGLSERLTRATATDPFHATRFVLEPGRVLVSASGVYLTRVIDVKTSGGKAFALVDGGIHQALLPITSNAYRVVNVAHADSKDGHDVLLGGPLCTSADQWHSAVRLPRAEVGDVIAILNSGAYGLSASMSRFLSHGAPAEVLLDRGAAHVIRDRETPDDLLRGQSLPEHLR